jgi:hypothetical protein
MRDGPKAVVGIEVGESKSGDVAGSCGVVWNSFWWDGESVMSSFMHENRDVIVRHEESVVLVVMGNVRKSHAELLMVVKSLIRTVGEFVVRLNQCPRRTGGIAWLEAWSMLDP